MTVLDDHEQVRRLKYAYLRHLDLKQWDAFEALFVPEATGSYAELAFADRAELVGYMRRHLTDEILTFHTVHHPETTVDGDVATARWYLHDKVFVTAHDLVIEGAAFYEDRLRRTEDGWRFTHTGYERTFETSWSTAALPGWNLKRGRAFGLPASSR
ncbi:nuclear transport factor 2 family protein [Nocardioides sp. HDW12B]|uniref:nuclear transport factor 2 family protein n=1 Tax=Nocardioides sp. HDW12B TaxID=2714939 RepID=UPI00140B3640|nr:nuclear transport factor 2 family protein [Nocardioides sp. HDW12B]QIK67678.1 nuclear transport factor 2 family protein [Nocardioides sp. HDW12B]